MSKGALKLGDLLDRLEEYGVISLVKRGKGSEMILLKPTTLGSMRGATYPIRNHGLGKDVPVPVINAALRRFEIDKKEFWQEKKSKK
jgi:hypothetical protein